MIFCPFLFADFSDEVEQHSKSTLLMQSCLKRAAQFQHQRPQNVS